MVQHMRTSHAQNDKGQFEINFHDERYLKFEGAGAVSYWRLELPQETNIFDFNTISDVIINIQYGAREGSAAFADAAKVLLPKKGIRMLSLKHNFGDLWYRLLNDDKEINHVTTLPLTSENLCMSSKYQATSITRITFFVNSNEQEIEMLVAPNIKDYNSDSSDTYNIDLGINDKYPGVLYGIWPAEKSEITEAAPSNQWMLLLKPADETASKLSLDDLTMVVEFIFDEVSKGE